MKRLMLVVLVLISSSSAWPQSSFLDGVVKIDHAWVQDFYWNLDELPGWGASIVVQETTMFGALYGYLDNKPSFVVFVGNQSGNDPLKYQGDVFYVNSPGQEQDVGNFTWFVTHEQATPAARLTITSNILNVTNQLLVRASFAEVDKVDMITGGDWNVVRRVLGVSFGDLYSISDERVDSDGIVFAEVIDTNHTDRMGVAGYFPPGKGNNYAMLIDFLNDSDVFYVFFADNTGMYGRYWLLDVGEDPTGNGNEFRGVVDNLHSPFSGGNGGGTANPNRPEGKRAVNVEQEWSKSQSYTGIRSIEMEAVQNSKTELEPMFSNSEIATMYERLSSQLHLNKAASR